MPFLSATTVDLSGAGDYTAQRVAPIYSFYAHFCVCGFGSDAGPGSYCATSAGEPDGAGGESATADDSW